MPCRVPKRRFSCGAPQHLTKNQEKSSHGHQERHRQHIAGNNEISRRVGIDLCKRHEIAIDSDENHSKQDEKRFWPHATDFKFQF